MDDLEMTKRCAEAMGWKQCGERKDFDEVKALPVAQFPGAPAYQYAPLKSDSDAMALVKRFGLLITPIFNQRMANEGLSWVVTNYRGDGKGGSVADTGNAEDIALNRAIVECVAKMQLAVQPERAQEAG